MPGLGTPLGPGLDPPLKLGQDNGLAVDYTEDVTQLSAASRLLRYNAVMFYDHGPNQPGSVVTVNRRGAHVEVVDVEPLTIRFAGRAVPLVWPLANRTPSVAGPAADAFTENWA
ncbi:hypothetical protein [Nonomuraea sp. SYSU D8015]|uniref:hypothetical protein n=1 Tax=Nonomuraea sp. SYSU D8015 TaxID=2593644 RepID=UPI00166038F1|nr:hypothetical protein [Nonomuraea sp. SYSU D8015]